MTKNEQWSKETAAIFNGVLLYSIAGVLHSILSPIEALYSFGDTLSSFGTGEGLAGASAFTVFTYILSAGIIGGYILFLLGLSGFARILEPNDSASVGKIRTGVILGLIATGVGFIPLIGWIVGGILNIIAFIMMLIAYSALKNSRTFPAGARRGAGSLFTSQILLIIGVVLGWIPFVGGIFRGILNIIAFILLLTGWATIKNTQPEAPAYSMPEAPVNRQ
ncbi:MAG: hypothetical protein LBS42_09960 [Tannerella sp.]|jgi:uncharacterized membrane protein|nr:hypothetical protein [Tannerella sp.]